MYFDDVRFYFANRWCGELRAIDEFNDENYMRKIDEDRSLADRPSKLDPWYKSMYVCHILDHEVRNKTRERTGLSIQDHYDYMKASSLY
jgi:hypothetical protein